MNRPSLFIFCGGNGLPYYTEETNAHLSTSEMIKILNNNVLSHRFLCVSFVECCLSINDLF